MKPTYRRVLTSFWTDPDVRRLARSVEAKGVLLYLFTGPDTTLSGLYWQPLEDIAHRCGVALETVERLMEQWEGTFVSYDRHTEEVLVHRTLRHNVGDTISPRDNRFKGLVRQVADTHSDTLVATLVKLYPGVEWPEEISGRAAEGASKGLQPAPDKEIQGFPQPENGRGFEASHTHTHALTHSEHPGITTSPATQPPPTPTPSGGRYAGDESPEGKSTSEPPRAKPIDVPRITDAVLHDEARRAMGAGTRADERIRFSKAFHQLLHQVRDRGHLLNAIRGFGLLRDAGQFNLRPGKSYTPGILLRWGRDGTVYHGESDKRGDRRFLDVCAEAWIEHDTGGGINFDAA